MLNLLLTENNYTVDYNQATLHAATGAILMLPGWEGYFKWDWEKKELYFQNGDYYLDNQQLIDKGIRDRDDWYYII